MTKNGAFQGFSLFNLTHSLLCTLTNFQLFRVNLRTQLQVYTISHLIAWLNPNLARMFTRSRPLHKTLKIQNYGYHGNRGSSQKYQKNHFFIKFWPKVEFQVGITVTSFMVGTSQTRDMGNGVSSSGQDPFWHSGPLRINSGPFPLLRIRIFCLAARGARPPATPHLSFRGEPREKRGHFFRATFLSCT